MRKKLSFPDSGNTSIIYRFWWCDEEKFFAHNNILSYIIIKRIKKNILTKKNVLSHNYLLFILFFPHRLRILWNWVGGNRRAIFRLNGLPGGWRCLQCLPAKWNPRLQDKLSNNTVCLPNGQYMQLGRPGYPKVYKILFKDRQKIKKTRMKRDVHTGPLRCA